MRSIDPQLNLTRPVRVQLLALTAYMYVAMGAGPLVPAARAGAIVNASGGGADVDVPKSFDDPHNGPSLAFAIAHDSGTNGSWSASAAVIGPAVSSENVTLQATATATWLGAPSHQNPGAAAFAQWTDQLKFENPDVLDARIFTAFFVIFQPFVDGTISGAGSARLEVIANDHFQSADFPGYAGHGINFLIPAIDLELGLVNLRMTLYANASTLAIPAPYFSEADFSHTAVLPRLILAGANGNYVPGTEQLRIVGTSGFEYSVGAVPEPATAALLAFGGAALLSFRGRRGRIR
ncbi:MAG TPA: PEP-CTERM sorting domain-containing protein [Planctomycetaceae bacterium]